MAKDGTPVFLGDVAALQVAGEARRGVGEWNGEGEAVSGIVVSRFGANTFQVGRHGPALWLDNAAGFGRYGRVMKRRNERQLARVERFSRSFRPGVTKRLIAATARLRRR